MYRVLIVEDDPMVSMINEQYIKRNKNFEIVGKCSDGSSALEFLEHNEVDLLVLDVYMPHMDGFETLRRIRNFGGSLASWNRRLSGKAIYIRPISNGIGKIHYSEQRSQGF